MGLAAGIDLNRNPAWHLVAVCGFGSTTHHVYLPPDRGAACAHQGIKWRGKFCVAQIVPKRL
jgi:hypothetical protein